MDIQQILPGAYLQAGVHLPVGPRAGIEVGTRANLMVGLVDDVRQPMVELQGFAGLTVGLGGRKVSRARQR